MTQFTTLDLTQRLPKTGRLFILLRAESGVGFAERSGLVIFPPEERPWAEGFEATDRLVVIDAVDDGALLLDYRNGGQPNLVVAHGLTASQGVRLEDLGPFASLLPQLRYPT